MKEIKYRCEICRYVVYDKGESKRSFIGFEFGSTPVGPKKADLVARHFIQCERHICVPCLRGLAELAQHHAG